MLTSSTEKLVLHVFGAGSGCGYGNGYGGGWRRCDEGFDSLYFADGCIGQYYGGGADFSIYADGDGYGFGYNYCYMRLVEVG
jgi:hypothetical protein